MNATKTTIDRKRVPMTFRDAVAIGFRRKRVILCAFAAIFGVVAFVLILQPNVYEAEMKILVKRDRVDPPVSSDQSIAISARPDTITDHDLSSEAELLKSRDLLERAVVECNYAPAGTPNLSDQNQNNNVYVLAKALVYARTGIESYRTQVIDQCMLAINTELSGQTLALGRELAAYVIAADLVGLPSDKNEIFKSWLQRTLTETLVDGRNLRQTNEQRPNNWGTMAGASRAAVALYLGDKAELDRTAQVFKGLLGDRSTYAGFKYGTDLSWQCDPTKPVGINPLGCTKEGHSIDGVLPDDQRRGGSWTWPPPKENYVYEALQGMLAQAEILRRAGYDTFNWSDKALLRAFLWLHDQDQFPAAGDDRWQPHLVNYWYGSTFPAPVPAQPGKNVGWTDWTHGPGRTKMPLSPTTTTTEPAPAPAPAPAPTEPAPAPAPAPVIEVTVRVEENNSNVLYLNNWYTDVLKVHSGGTAARSLTNGARATFTFTGTAVRWIGYRDSSSGIARVYIDDVLKAEIDTHSSTVQPNTVIYSATGLTYQSHRFAIEVLGKKNSNARGRWVWVDAFEYAAPSTASLSIQTEALSLASTSVTLGAVERTGLDVGYAQIKTGSVGYALVERVENGALVGQTAVPASSLQDNGRVFVELNDQASTGLAIANPNLEPNIVEFFFTDETGVDFGRGTLTVPAHGQFAAFLNEAPFNGPKPFRGTFTFVASQPAASTAIHGKWNERSEFLFSTMRVAELSPVHNETAVIPHFAFGQGWNTSIVLTNPTDENVNGSVQLTNGLSFRYSIAPRGFREILLANSAQSVSTGSAFVVPQAGSYTPYAQALFSYKVGGVTVTKASVAGSRAGSAFQIDVKRDGTSARTGIALVNTSDQDIVVNFDLKQSDSATGSWQVSRTMAARGRAAMYLDEIPGFDQLPSILNGVLRIGSSSSSLAAVGLRSEYNVRGELLLTTTVARDERTANPNSEFFVPHFASGLGYRTEFVVVGDNLTSAMMPIELFDRAGQPLLAK